MDRRLFMVTIPAAVSGCLSLDGSTTATRPEPPEEANEPPAFADADEVHYPASAGGPIVVTAEPSKAELPGATIEFEATNVGRSRFETNLYDWQLYKYVDERWWFLGVFDPLQSSFALDEGETHAWEATIGNDRNYRRPTALSPSSKSSFTLGGVGSGLYAFSVVGTYGNGVSGIAAVTPFELVGEAVELQPTANLETSREGETVRVTSPSGSGEYELTARRKSDTDEGAALVPEWGLRQEGIRNSVPYLIGDARRVVYEVDGHPPVFPMEEIDGTTVGIRDYEFGFIEDTTFAHEDFAVEFGLREV